MTLLSIQGVSRTFAPGAAAGGVHEIDLDVHEGEMVSLLGPSGCGKTTTLRCIAGLETPDRGRIELDGAAIFHRGTGHAPAVDIPPERRRIGMVFQDYALWPHMDVFRNVAFGVESGRRSRGEVAAAVEAALRSVQLWDQRDRRISQLSGGQQQRVALARALAPRPRIVLFDEPLSNLDTRLRDDLRQEILDLRRRLGLTSIWVTHDQEEALGMSDRIVLMNEGRVEQIGTPADLWSAPATAFAAGFLGAANRLVGTVVEEHGPVLAVDGGPRLVLGDGSRVGPGDRAIAYIRTGAVGLSEEMTDESVNAVPIEVVGQTFHGDYAMVTVRGEGIVLRVRVEGTPGLRVRARIAELAPEHLVAFRDDVGS